MNIQHAINQVIDHQNLSYDDMQAVMHGIMTGQATDAQIAGLLVALRMKGESVDEITAAAQVMRKLATAVNINDAQAVDIVGTGGDGAKLFNVSTASSVVAAAAGCTVAKHGNRSVSSSSGSADLLESAGIALDLNAQEVARCINEIGIGFMFAVNHHSAMKHAIGPRKQLATRTIFNLLGPMTNPAGVTRQLLGVYSKDLVLPIAQAMQALGSQHVLVVHSADGLDEISVATHTYVAELKHDGKQSHITEYQIQPQDFNISPAKLALLSVNNAEESLRLINKAFNPKERCDETQAARHMIALNAGAALYNLTEHNSATTTLTC